MLPFRSIAGGATQKGQGDDRAYKSNEHQQFHDNLSLD
jgi:hypothetical protein